jgi:hypothetical protein
MQQCGMRRVPGVVAMCAQMNKVRSIEIICRQLSSTQSH